MTKWIRSGTTAFVATVVSALALPYSGCSDGGVGESVVPNVSAIVFASRAFENADGSHNVAGGANQVVDYARYTPGGHLYVLSPPTPDGVLTDLTAEFEGVDIGGLDLSFDAQQVVFSMQHADDNRYHLYLANVDGSGDIRQLTFGDFNDVNPVFLPGDRVAFATNEPYTALGTRADEYNHSRVVSQIGTISIAAGDADRRLCSQNLSHAGASMSVGSNGQLVFSRWEHLEGVNDIKLFQMNPDCTNMTAVAGQFNKGFNSIVQAQELEEPGTFVAVATSRRGTIQAGALMLVDARSTTSTNPNLYIDVQQARFTSLTPDVPTDEESPETGAGRYRTPRPLQGSDNLLVSWANGDVNERNELAETAPNFGIYLFNPETQSRTLVYDDPNMWDLYAIPVVARDEPPVITPSVDGNPDPTTPAIIGSIDITQTSLDETVSGAQFDNTPLGEALGDAVRVRIIEGFSSEIGSVGQFGLTMAEGAAILGETPIYSDGSWRAAVPAYLPYHLQPIDRYGLAIRNQRLWIQAMPGETRTCGGCHESRSTRVSVDEGATTIAQQVGPDMTTFLNIPDRTEYPWYGSSSRETIQDVLDRNCAGCHSQGGSDPAAAALAARFYTVNVTTMEGEMLTYQIPYLDLSSRLLEVYYEDEVVSYPASYVTLLYPSAMMGDSMATGDVPPNWVTPSDARGSVVVQVMNQVSESDAADLAYSDRPLHPENVGVTVSREDREALIRAIDMGGQYYSRWNVPGGTDWSTVIDYPAAP